MDSVLSPAQTPSQAVCISETRPDTDKAGAFKFHDVCIFEETRLQIGTCPPDVKNDIQYCLKTCLANGHPGGNENERNTIVALVNDIKLSLPKRITAEQPTGSGRSHRIYDSSDNIVHKEEIRGLSTLSLCERNNSATSCSKGQIKSHHSQPEATTPAAWSTDTVNSPLRADKSTPTGKAESSDLDHKENYHGSIVIRHKLRFISQDSRFDTSWNSTINRHLIKLLKKANPGLTIETGTVLARTTPAGMEAVDGVLHHIGSLLIENFGFNSRREQPDNIEPTTDKASNDQELLIETLATGYSTQFCENIKLLKLADGLYKRIDILCRQKPVSPEPEPQPEPQPEDVLINSLTCMFKQLAQREYTDFIYRCKASRMKEHRKEKAILFIEKDQKILGWNYRFFCLCLYEALRRNGIPKAPEKILFLSFENGQLLKKHFIDTILEKFQNSFLVAALRIITIFSETKKYLDIDEEEFYKITDGFNSMCDQIECDHDTREFLAVVNIFIQYCEKFLNMIPHHKHKQESLVLLAVANMERQAWIFLTAFTLYIVNSSESNLTNIATYFNILNRALRISSDGRKDHAQICIQNREIINRALSTLFKTVKVEFNKDPSLLTAAIQLLESFFCKSYLGHSKKSFEKEDEPVKLDVIDTFTENICSAYSKFFTESEIRQSKDKLKIYIEDLQKLSRCYQLFKRPARPLPGSPKEKLNGIIRDLMTMHEEQSDQFLSSPSAPHKTTMRNGNGKGKSKKKK